MSRGPGQVQRAILAVLDEEPTGLFSGWLSIPELTERVHGEASTRAQIESVRRACKSLAAAGAVETEYGDELVTVREARVSSGEWPFGRREHFGDRKHLYVHLLLSVEERESRAQFYRDSLDRLSVEESRISSRLGSPR